MNIEHVALWTDDLDELVYFYVTYFGATFGSNYNDFACGFESQFLNFRSGARLEIMKTSPIKLECSKPGAQRMD